MARRKGVPLGAFDVEESMLKTGSNAESFLLGMAMVFGFGAPLGNRLTDRPLLCDREQSSVERDWRTVGSYFRVALESDEWQSLRSSE